MKIILDSVVTNVKYNFDKNILNSNKYAMNEDKNQKEISTLIM